MNVAVAGGREYRLTVFDRGLLLGLHMKHGITLLLHGGCQGADLDAAGWARSMTIKTKEYKPAWNKHGLRAGPIRNAEMVADCDLLVAFPGGRGTATTVKAARRLGKEVIEA